MSLIKLRKVKKSDIAFFSKWWRDEELINLTSGVLDYVSDEVVEKYFKEILTSLNNIHRMIVLNQITIGHISLNKRRDGWFETQIVIGENKYRNKGYGTIAIKKIIDKAKKLSINKIFLEVRPNNKRAIKTYEKCDFVKTKIIRQNFNPNLPEILRMEKII
jgi:RimJ/RimL family protein N-acetyltransferase